MAKAPALLLLLGLAACSGETGGPAAPDSPNQAAVAGSGGARAPDDAPRPSASPNGGIVLPRLPASDLGDAAALRGRLVARERCLYLDAGGTLHLIAALSPSLRWDEASGQLRSGDRAARPGDQVTLGGSQADAGTALPWTEAPAAGCDTARIWIATGFSTG